MATKQRNTAHYYANVFGYNVATQANGTCNKRSAWRYSWVLRKGLRVVAAGTVQYRTRAAAMQHGLAAAVNTSVAQLPRYCCTPARIHVGMHYAHVYGGSNVSAVALRMCAITLRAHAKGLTYIAPRTAWQQCYSTARKQQRARGIA